jgi:hypothetical protein
MEVNPKESKMHKDIFANSHEAFIEKFVEFYNEENDQLEIDIETTALHFEKFRWVNEIDNEVFLATVRELEESTVEKMFFQLAAQGFAEMSIDENGDGLYWLNEEQEKAIDASLMED